MSGEGGGGGFFSACSNDPSSGYVLECRVCVAIPQGIVVRTVGFELRVSFQELCSHDT